MTHFFLVSKEITTMRCHQTWKRQDDMPVLQTRGVDFETQYLEDTRVQ